MANRNTTKMNIDAKKANTDKKKGNANKIAFLRMGVQYTKRKKRTTQIQIQIERK